MSQKNLRELREELENKILSPFAAKSSCSKGRERYEEPCSVRTEFQRDRDRILYSKSFRRLMHKTQVFIAPEGDHYRTRLTHTIDVSQIARTTARALNLNEDLTEAIALGHDLGHAPFGHAGEKALSQLMKKYTGSGFHHCRQSLRVVDFLERDGGLNLTMEVRNGIISHTKGSGELNKPSPFEKPATLEAQIVRISDRLAYINHDIDDAVRSNIIKNSDLPKDVVDLLGEGISSRINTMILDIVESSWEKPEIIMSNAVSEGLEKLKNFMFDRVYTNSPAKLEEHKANILIGHLFEYYMENPHLIPEDIVRRGSAKEALDVEFLKDKSISEKEKENRKKARAVCDYIAGMTDRFAISQHKKLFIPKGWGLD